MWYKEICSSITTLETWDKMIFEYSSIRIPAAFVALGIHVHETGPLRPLDTPICPLIGQIRKSPVDNLWYGSELIQNTWH